MVLALFKYLSLIRWRWRQSTRSLRQFDPPHRSGDRVDVGAMQEVGHLSLAMEASLIGYLVSGIFISVFYYPSFWILSAFVVALRKAALNGAEHRHQALSPATARGTLLRPAALETRREASRSHAAAWL
jgi:hypothetical protein